MDTVSPPLELETETVPAPAPGGTPPQIEIPPRLPPAGEWKAWFEERYDVEEATFELNDRPTGPSISFMISGDLTPPSSSAARGVAGGDPREISQAFLKEEARNFGLSRVEDLREAGSHTSAIGWTSIAYHRYLGDLRLEGVRINVLITAEGKIHSVSGMLVPLPDELFEAAAQPTLSRAQVVALVSEANANDPDSRGSLSAEGMYGGTLRLSKWARPTPPYVVWKVRAGQYEYIVDAFTGAILDRMPTLIPAK